jgi:hypothetical protein
MLHDLHTELDRGGMALRIVGAHGAVRDLLRVDGISDKVGGLGRDVTLMGLAARRRHHRAIRRRGTLPANGKLGNSAAMVEIPFMRTASSQPVSPQGYSK